MGFGFSYQSKKKYDLVEAIQQQNLFAMDSLNNIDFKSSQASRNPFR
jgi:hypothetical protein